MDKKLIATIMKLKLILAGMFLAGAAWAQSEQWLEYHTGNEGRAYHRWI